MCGPDRYSALYPTASFSQKPGQRLPQSDRVCNQAMQQHFTTFQPRSNIHSTPSPPDKQVCLHSPSDDRPSFIRSCNPLSCFLTTKPAVSVVGNYFSARSIPSFGLYTCGATVLLWDSLRQPATKVIDKLSSEEAFLSVSCVFMAISCSVSPSPTQPAAGNTHSSCSAAGSAQFTSTTALDISYGDFAELSWSATSSCCLWWEQWCSLQN